MAVRRSGDASISLIVATARRFSSFTMSWSSLAISASAEAWFLAGEEAGCLPEVDDEVGFAAFFGTGLLAIQPASTETSERSPPCKTTTDFVSKDFCQLNFQIEETLLLTVFRICKRPAISPEPVLPMRRRLARLLLIQGCHSGGRRCWWDWNGCCRFGVNECEHERYRRVVAM